MASVRITAAVLLSVFAVLFGQSAYAQTVTAGPDSSRVSSNSVSDSLRRTEKLFGRRVTRPQKATLLALVLPGSGQIYNRQYWKLPLVYGGLGATGYGLFLYQSRYKEYSNGKKAYLNGTPIPNLSGARVSKETSIENIQRGVIFYRRYRDSFIAYNALVYGVTILDALVAAHLRDFDIGDDLSLRLDPAVLPTQTTAPGAGLALTLRLK
ncbi:DUF5683 domain-containing protein [Hymenobacter metallilatus]|uniref:DUF5683 domain-containing protein n=1 Tax=Hymenobacter metallilatus TaxID=2493666 RepID=A0A428IXV1_9BACT|nr:DUF5683 domain-containing protein [Hymenobacter metallilatus]RSK23891.1 hypothetical protein EI290_21595 [Hymenobacter metallilatus]